MALTEKYDPKSIESYWYDYWLKNNYFHSEVNDKEAYTILIPPPNVTGILHMGHMLNNTIQDILIRRARLRGYNACWIPGTDHASIATEAKVVALLKAKGIEKKDISREAFLEHAWDWTNKHSGIIFNQLKTLGASCDWDRAVFTLDTIRYDSVIRVFVDLYQKGLIYKGHRMINWDPQAQTTVSDEEVIYEEQQGKLYHIQYQIADSADYLTIATTRPETIFGDTAICVHPDDDRYQHLRGKKAIVPIVNRLVPIIADPYVAMEFGTGCLKVTPAHDSNDQVLGDKHQLESIDIFRDNASLNHHGLHYEGKDRFAVREAIEKELEQMGALAKVEIHNHKVATSERTQAVIEPKLREQWFLKMKALAKPALDAVLQEEVQLVPDKFISTYRHWMEHIRDWNISRQLWWGHQIPVYYYGSQKADYVVALSAEEALRLAQKKSGNPNLKLHDLTQETDVLDTWFSAWLWPISVFNGILDPDNKEIQYYYPTQDLVTGPDIIFFWVARMVVSGYEFMGKKPFSKVYFTGLVRDKKRRKMSKSLGNSPDPELLIKQYGADGVRVGLLLAAPAGNDLMFDESLCEQGKKFANKIFNASKLILGLPVDSSREPTASEEIAVLWYKSTFQKALLTLESLYEKYRMSDALMTTYKLIWDDFCSWFLEMIKPPFGDAIAEKTKFETIDLLEQNLKILHPFMPFITEEIWQNIKIRTKNEALVIADWPVPRAEDMDAQLLAEFELASAVVAKIRSIRKEKQISFKEKLQLFVCCDPKHSDNLDSLIQKLTNLETIAYVDKSVENAITFRVQSNAYFIPFSETINTALEQKKLAEELEYAQGFLKSVQKKLQNDRFICNAPEKVVANERKKAADAEAKIKILVTNLKKLKES